MAAERERRLARSVAIATSSPRGVGRRGSTAAAQENPYLGLLLRWWWVIALCTLAGLLVGLLYNRFGPVPYQSTALVAVNSETTLLDSRPVSTRQQGFAAETFAAQMASPPVAELVSKELAGRYDVPPGELLAGLQNKRIDIRAIKNSNLVSVTATDPDPQLAFALADAYARAFVGAVNQAAGEAVASRRRELESQIEYSRQQLTTTQLKQREQDLNTQLQTARGQLLQLQLQYQTELQRQIEAERAQSLAEQRARGGPQALSPEALERIVEVEASQDRARSGALGAISAQVSDAQGQIGDLSAQLAEVRAAIDQLQSQGEVAEGAPPPPSSLDVASEVATKQTELQQLQREIEYDRQVAQQRQQLQNSQNQILNQIQGQRNRLVQLQFANERAVATAADAEARADDDDNNNSAKRAAERAAQNRDRTLEFNALQQREIEGTINNLNAQLNAAKQREAQLPPEVTPAQTAAKQQRIIALEQEITQLKTRQTQVDRQEQTSRTQLQELQRREQTLAQQLEGARGRLRQAQSAYQQEVQRQAEAERRQTIEAEQRAAQTEAAQAALSPSLSPEQQAQIEQASNSAAQVRSDWLQLINEQQKGVQGRIDELNGELQQVRDALAQLPPSTDRAGMTSFATAYAGVLGQLTQDFVELQINTGAATSPVDRFGEASEPTLVNSLRRMIPIGAGAGMGLGCAIAYLLEMRRQRRLAYLPNTQTTTLAVPATLGTTSPAYNGAQRAAYRRSMQPTARVRRRRPASA